MSEADPIAPPVLYSEDAEKVLIGCVFISPHIYQEIDVSPEDFYIHRHGWIWDAYGRLHKGGLGIDVVTVAETLNRMDKLAEVGGMAYLAEIIAGSYIGVEAESYARIVKDYSRRRAWVNVANRMARLAFDKKSNLENEAPGVLTELTQAVRTRGAASHISNYTRQVLDEAYERMENPQDIWGIPTGFIDFDRITGGLQKSEVLNISGEPRVGKSKLAMQMAFQMAKAGHPGVIYSLEMQGEAVIRRRISHMAKVQARSIKSGRIADNFEKVVSAVEEIDRLPLYMSDDVQWTTTSLRADLARMKAQYKIEWFVLDYAYLLKDGMGLSENDRTGLISSNLKAVCRGLELAGIVILSLNKGGMGGLPSGENLRGNNQQFYDADLLMFMVKAETPNEVKCIFGKGRELEQDEQFFSLIALPGFPAFENAALPGLSIR
jgi:replicative DNA helicase